MKFKKLILGVLLCFHQTGHSKQLDITVGIQEGAGLFAEIHKVLQTIIHYEKDLAHVHVDWTDEFFPYKDGVDENGWDLFFEPIPSFPKKSPAEETEKIIINSTSVLHELHDQCCTAPWIAYDQYLPYRQFVHKKLTQYIRLKPHIQKKCQDFYDTHMQKYLCIGVHARIAKAHAWLVPGKRLAQLDAYFKEIDTLIKKHPEEEIKIFVASDSHFAVQKCKERYGDCVVYIDAFRSSEDQDPCILYTNASFLKQNKNIWHQKKHRYFGGVTTLLDCLLLSKCKYLIHTTSNLAFFATYYNPEITSIYLPRGVPLKDCTVKGNPNIVNAHLNPC